MKIKAVGFDIDGTLYPNSSMYVYSTFAFIKHPVLFSHFGKARKSIRRIRYNGDFRTAQAKLVAASMHMGVKEAMEVIERDLYGSLGKVFKNVKPYKDIKPVLISLKAEGLALGAMSDLPVGKKLEYLGIGDLFDFSFSTEETNFLKPSPVPFKHLVKEFDLLPEEILYVGNNYEYDILGAVSVGLRTAHLSRRPVPGSKADFTFSSFTELRDWIFSINN